MILDEVIERYTRNAEYERTHGNLQGCLEFRQLVEWLKDYKRLLEQDSYEDVAKERYEDLCEYFGGAKDILKHREDFKAWLDRMKWHVYKAEELSEENKDLRDQLAMRDRFQKQEPCEDATLKDIFCMGCEYKEQKSKTGHCEDCKHFRKIPYHADTCFQHKGFCPKGDWYCADFEPQEER